MVDRLKRKWKSDRAEGLNEYMKATDLGFALRQIMPKLTFYEELTQDGDIWTLNMTSTFKDHKIVFKMGESFVDHTPDGKTMKTTFTIQGNKIVAQQGRIKDKEVPSSYTREVLDNGEMLLTLEAGGTTCKRYFKPHP